MKEQTKAGLSKPLEVYAETMSKLDGDTRAKMLVEDSVKRTLRNQRSKLNPVEPNSLENLVIDGSKTSEPYKLLFRKLIEKCEKNNLYLDPKYVHLDFEKAVIKAVHKVFNREVIIRGFFYHLLQSTHRKVQALGLEKLYCEYNTFSEFCGMLDGLAFLHLTDVEQGMFYLKSIMPDTALDLVPINFVNIAVFETYFKIVKRC
ncbi:hypothetical protein ACI65C_004629 [Semiaphis heraclei]